MNLQTHRAIERDDGSPWDKLGREEALMVFTIISKLVGIILILCGLLFVTTAVGFPITEWIPRFALPKEIIIGILLMVGGKLLYGTARVFVVGRGRGY